jgi:hypothetical protein
MYSTVTPPTPSQIETIVDNFGSTLKDELLTAVRGSETTVLDTWIQAKTDAYSDRFVDSFKNYNLLHFLPSEITSAANVGLGWTNAALGLNRWFYYFKYPADTFEMETINLKTASAPAGTPDFYKTQIKIKRILDLGIAQACRYEHYRFHHGGEWGTFYGEITSPESWDLTILDKDKPINMFSAFDGHGYNDGTCNFYMLAEIGIWDPGLGVFVDKPVLLWIDEQEYFAERWHVFHPRDNAFEGLMGTLGSAFTSLTIFKGLNIQNFANNFWAPYQQLTPNARMATSGTATVIADDSHIYSASMYWALTDKTWRWRNYPVINEVAGDSIDKKSVALRDDMTITFKGKKNVQGTVVDGYWYQRYLDPNNRKTPGAAVPFTHPWRFMAKDAFDVANKNFYRMGMYEQATEPLNTNSQHYTYKGYTPRTHVYTVRAGAMVRVKPGTGTVMTVSANSLVSNSVGATNIYRISLNPDGTNPITSPMYSTMKMQHPSMVPPVKLRFSITNGLLYARFADIRDDDIKLPVELNTATVFYCRPDDGTNTWIEVKKADLVDLNVWADAPIDKIDITHNSAAQQYGFQFTLNDCGRYRLTHLKVGYINGGVVQTLPAIPLGAPAISGTNATYTSSGNSISKNLWETYFSEEGRARYGTNVWVVDAFGNSNTIENIGAVGIPAPSIAVSPSTIRGPVADKPALAGQQITFNFQNAEGAGGITTIVWNFGDGTPAVTSLTPPVHRYTRPGTYVVTVTAIGPDFPDVKTITVTVRPGNLIPLLRFMND